MRKCWNVIVGYGNVTTCSESGMENVFEKVYQASQVPGISQIPVYIQDTTSEHSATFPPTTSRQWTVCSLPHVNIGFHRTPSTLFLSRRMMSTSLPSASSTTENMQPGS